MNEKTRQAYEWAKKQQFTSVAADYARMLAHELERVIAENARLREELEAANDAISDFEECVGLAEPYRTGKEIAVKYHRAVNRLRGNTPANCGEQGAPFDEPMGGGEG